VEILARGRIDDGVDRYRDIVNAFVLIPFLSGRVSIVSLLVSSLAV
jgi:hypothetical protein